MEKVNLKKELIDKNLNELNELYELRDSYQKKSWTLIFTIFILIFLGHFFIVHRAWNNRETKFDEINKMRNKQLNVYKKKIDTLQNLVNCAVYFDDIKK